VVVLLYGSSIWERIGIGGSGVPPFFQWEETGETAQEEFKSWKNKGKGLKLTIINAMDPEWYEFFDIAVADWNASPSLSLTPQMANPDNDCELIPGKLKACNGDYGKSGWSGLNEAWIDDRGWITGSTAKMNEYYLLGSGYDEKRFVTCHEIGHGFGLPHRDTNVNNPNIGTCLDYTTNYKSNVSPDEVDYSNLETLYGTINRRRTLQESVELDEDERLPQHLRNASTEKSSYKNGRLLLKSQHREIYEREFPDGSKIITTVLLAR
jgi:hypothetical protein